MYFSFSCVCVYLFLVSGAVSKQLVRIDTKYAALFNDGAWKDSTADRLDMSARFGPYFLLTERLFLYTQRHFKIYARQEMPVLKYNHLRLCASSQTPAIFTFLKLVLSRHCNASIVCII